MMSTLDNGGIVFTLGYVMGAAVPVFLLTLLFVRVAERIATDDGALALFMAALAATVVAGVLSGIGTSTGGLAQRLMGIAPANFVLHMPGAFVSIGLISIVSHLRGSKDRPERQT